MARFGRRFPVKAHINNAFRRFRTNVTFIEPGGDATFAVSNTNDIFTTWGASAVATDFVHGGHVKSHTHPFSGGGYGSYIQTPNGVVRDSGSRISFFLYINTLPGASPVTYSKILGINVAGSSSVFYLRLTSGGILQIANNSNTQLGSDGSTLSTGVWYRISVAYTITSTSVNRIEVFKDAVSDISVTNGTLTQIVSSGVTFGNVNDNTTASLRTSDYYIDDSSSLTDTGNIWVTAKRTVANGTLNEFTTQVGSGGSGYGSGHSSQVNERPLDTTNGWSLSNTTRAVEEYTIEGASAGDIDISSATIVDYMGWVSAKVDSTSNSPVHRIIVNGVQQVKTLTISDAVYTKVAGSSIYPTGGADIGIDAQYTTTPHTTTLNEAGIIFAYIPATESTARKTWDGLVKASIKTWQGIVDASVKTWDGLQ